MFHEVFYDFMGVSLNGGTPISHPKMIIFSRQTHGFVGETHHFRKPPYGVKRVANSKTFDPGVDFVFTPTPSTVSVKSSRKFGGKVSGKNKLGSRKPLFRQNKRWELSMHINI